MPFIQSVIDMQPFYVWRGIGGLLMFLSHFVFAWNVWRMTYGASAKAVPLVPALAGERRGMNKLVLIAGGSTLVYAGLALVMGVLPGITLSQTPPGPGVKPLTALEAEGRDVYVSNGCSYCHTQQVRPLAQDKVFGRPSAPGDFAYQTPELLGSERTGPDLTNVGVRQPSAVWQYIHLYNPRAVVPELDHAVLSLDV